MRKYALTALCLLACASIITASTITQKVDATSRNIAPIDRIKVMTDSLYDLTNTDVPALISNLNAAGDGTAGLLQSVTPSTGTFTVNTNLTVTGNVIAGNLTTTTDSVNPAGGTFSIATNANIGNDLVVTNDATVGGTLTVTTGAVLPADSIGATEVDSGTAAATVTAAAGSGVDYVGAMQTKVVTFTNVVLTAADGSDRGASVEFMTFPEGRIWIAGAAINATCTTHSNFEASVNDVFLTSVGTAAAGAAEGTLTGTEADLIASTEHDTVDGNTLVFQWEADMTAGGDSVFDGTSSAVKLYANMAVADTSILVGEAITNTVSGTMRVHWLFLGDD